MNTAFQRLQREHRAEILTDWLQHLAAAVDRHSPHPPGLDAQRESLFDAVLTTLAERPNAHDFMLDPDSELGRYLNRLVTEQARQLASPSETVGSLLALKQRLARALLALDLSSDAVVESLLWLDRLFDALSLFAFKAFVDIRERLITEQSLSLLELSTPVLKLWHQVLLLPLVGVIDTLRARQVTERLLEAIAEHEARVTILDLTGVPVLDTSVAQHLMKTIDAARLLGTRIVMTGISPEGAQTLTKLGIRFADVVSRATLRAGIAEALLIVERRIAPLNSERQL
ncbi:rsbT co-antagonist protein RsbR [Allochromatium warmingii]|uniref:RsbT co-antagonist protein RsbR n=1 Tax=Allochromatium warmingii TaxID=61595 RepID=A0A1H3B9X5_ALLWA|nr:STAS domain-containing protein [Allochromatium warmingii]SDX38752.1 rsbT co-antagonist protein RsbR [Allochromatium warmingii]